MGGAINWIGTCGMRKILRNALTVDVRLTFLKDVIVESADVFKLSHYLSLSRQSLAVRRTPPT